MGSVFLVATTGCDTLTYNRFDTIEVGVSQKVDVQKTLGTPSYTLKDEWHYERSDRHLNVLIHFNVADTVTRKQWVDGMAGKWIDTNEPGESDSAESIRVRTIRD
jgi:outer membrane protein assembly factor BamE (lipoprotein component of BamABCDE complex)